MSLPAPVHRVGERRRPRGLRGADGSVVSVLPASQLLCSLMVGFFYYLSSIPGETFPEPGLGDCKWREGAREQTQRGSSQPPQVSLRNRHEGLHPASAGHRRSHTLLCSSFSIYMAHVSDVLKAVEEIAGEGIPQQLGASKDESPSWPTLNK